MLNIFFFFYIEFIFPVNILLLFAALNDGLHGSFFFYLGYNQNMHLQVFFFLSHFKTEKKEEDSKMFVSIFSFSV